MERQETDLPSAPDPIEASSRVDDQVTSDTPTRSGDDVRRRGWFWHWNNIVTQYSPLIGLNGIGLLNSYTVWTDRREASPHHGYAFPSQQSEAAFYGVDRSELIALNKILVTLDLIEIRKEIVSRTDEQGRRWRVPHNFYRVKDKGDDFNLTSDDVLKVAELAARDKAVFRHVRHIFSSRFSPIDANNIWKQILPEVALHPTWQTLAAKTAKDEEKAVARTLAGHAARKGSIRQVNNSDSVTLGNDSNDSASVINEGTSTTTVEPVNRGLAGDAVPVNNGSTADLASDVAEFNIADQTSVEPLNPTYHQDITTRSTTGFAANESSIDKSAKRSAGPGGDSAPFDIVSQTAGLTAFEEANGRVATPMERRLLEEMATQFTSAAKANNRTGWEWIADAIVAAVDSGSSYVAPKRVREILSRWERDGMPGNKPSRELASTGSAANQLWHDVQRQLRKSFNRDSFERVFGGVEATGLGATEVTLWVPDAGQAERLATEYRQLVTRLFNQAANRDLNLVLTTPENGLPELELRIDRPAPAPAEFIVEECGLSSSQVWARLQDELQRNVVPGGADVAIWLKETRLIGRGDKGELIVSVASQTARRRIEGRYRSTVERAAESLLGRRVALVLISDLEELANPVDLGTDENQLPA